MVLNLPLSCHILETCSWNQTLLSELQCPRLLNGSRNSICGAVMKLTGESASKPLGTGQGEVQDGSARPGKHLESVGRERERYTGCLPGPGLPSAQGQTWPSWQRDGPWAMSGRQVCDAMLIPGSLAATAQSAGGKGCCPAGLCRAPYCQLCLAAMLLSTSRRVGSLHV